MSSKEKTFFKSSEEVSNKIVEHIGYCFASDRITINGLKVGYMYRENPDDEQDSGWRFFAGDEDNNYANNPDNLGIYSVNTIAHYDRDIITFLDFPYDSAFSRNEKGEFEEESFEAEIEE